MAKQFIGVNSGGSTSSGSTSSSRGLPGIFTQRSPGSSGSRVSGSSPPTLLSYKRDAVAAGGSARDLLTQGFPASAAAQGWRQSDGRISLINYYLRSRQTRGLQVMKATTAKEIVNFLQGNPGDEDYSPDRNRTFVTVFEKAAVEASKAGDDNAKEMLLEAAGKARRLARKSGGRLPLEQMQAVDPYGVDSLQGISDQAMATVGDMRARLMAAPTPVKVGVALLALFAMKKLA